MSHWVYNMDQKYQLNLSGLEEIAPPFPSKEEIQALFLAARDKEAFKNSIETQWKIDLDDLKLHYFFGKAGELSFFKTVTISELLESWTEDDFVTLREQTKRALFPEQ